MTNQKSLELDRYKLFTISFFLVIFNPYGFRFIMDLFERLATEASRCCKYAKKETISSREIQTATKLILPGEIAKHGLCKNLKKKNIRFQNTKFYSCLRGNKGVHQVHG
jgi:hypothetical protein